jgi:hypothetical protein
MYVGYILFCDPDWLKIALADVDKQRVAICIDPEIPYYIGTGDPVFFLSNADPDRLIRCWARVARAGIYSLRTILRPGDRMDGLAHERVVHGRPRKLVVDPRPEDQGLGILFSEPHAVVPPISPRTANVSLQPEKWIYKLSPEEVLAMLTALPESAQDHWTKRAVARNNEIPALRKPPK